MEDLLADIDTSALVGKIIFLVVVVLIALLVQRIVVRAMRRALDASGMPKASIFINIVRTIIWLFALLAVLEPVFGIEPTAFMAALGVTSVIISFGLQDTVSNVVAGIGLMAGHVVMPGDKVSVGGFDGVVEDVSWRSTTVKNRDGRIQVIPNSVLNKTALTRLTDWSVTDCAVSFLVSPSTDLDACAQEVAELAKKVSGSVMAPGFETEVQFSEVTAFGIQGTAHMHLVDGTNFSVEKDKLIRAMSSRPWFCKGQDEEARQ
ncbi:MAG: mechanosensitive ion channel family protein [Tractidigestivibacter sp.]|jgi:small-conductance mechanosensitive channel|uniref:mechanosensitive ion channel family protein n=1 Tax=Tractidigestivibacter sp. TaxID=2847320 RepID=UPI003D8F1907